MELSTSWVSCAAALVVPVAILLLLRSHLGHPMLNLPPGPTPWPIIGNLNLMGPLPHLSIHQLSLKDGPIMQLRFGSSPVVVGSSVEMAKTFFKTMDLTFASRSKTSAGKYTAYDSSNILWAPYGPHWRQARKICHAELLSAKRIESYEYIRVEEMNSMLKSLYKAPGDSVVLRGFVTTFALNVMSRIVLGKKFSEDAAMAEAFSEMLEELSDLWGAFNVGDSIPWLEFLDLQGYVKRMKNLGKKLDELMEQVVEEHRARRREAAENFVAMDTLDVLLELAEDPALEVKLDGIAVKAYTMDLLSGGSKTPVEPVEWAICELLKNSKIIEKATQELDEVIGKNRWVQEEDIQNLPYIEAIVKETMRIHPPAPLLVPHVAREDCKVAGYDVPEGTRVIVNTWTIGRDSQVWDEPNEFRPERFLGKAIDVKGHDFELLPFGSGRRMCPGYSLGLKMVQSTLANLLHGFTWKLPNNGKGEDLDMEEKFGVTLSKKNPVVVVVEPRLPLHLYDNLC